MCASAFAFKFYTDMLVFVISFKNICCCFLFLSSHKSLSAFMYILYLYVVYVCLCVYLIKYIAFCRLYCRDKCKLISQSFFLLILYCTSAFDCFLRPIQKIMLLNWYLLLVSFKCM